MRRIIGLILTGVIVLSCMGCGQTQENENTVAPTEISPTQEQTEPTPMSTVNPTLTPSTPTPVVTPPKEELKQTTYNADALFAASKVQGRTAVYNYTNRKKEQRRGISLDYTAAAVEFSAYCEGDVVIQFGSLPKGGTSAPTIYVNIYVDNVMLSSRKECGIRTDVDFTIAKNLSKGTHTFRIERQNEAEKGQLYINSVTLKGVLGKKPANSSLYIEFIGDSITTGYGNLYPNLLGDVKPVQDQSSSCYQDGTRAWAYLTAKKLGADYSIVAQQGIGASVGWQPHTMLQTYTQTCYQTGRTQAWNFSRQPDLIVINLGTNDLGVPHSTGKEAVQKGFVDLLKLVRSKNPNAKILWVYGAMDTSGAPVVEAAVKEAGGNSKGFYAYTKLVPNGEGGIGHPVVSAHQKNAGLVAAEIKRLFGY